MRKPLPPSCRYFTFTFLLLLITLVPLCAQNFSAHNWYFGNSDLGIRFSRADNSPSLISTKANLGPGGSAVATDPVNANLLFYSDGATVYDVTHSAMPNGTGLTGNPAGNQPVVIARVPGTDTEYYIFTNTANGTTGGTISYSIVDMALFGNATFPAPAIGDVTATKNVAIGGLTNRSESMLVVLHENRRDFWLITHENGAPNYAVTEFNSSTPGPVSTTSYTLGLIEVSGNFSYHPATGRIAVSPQEANRDIEIVRFDPATGQLNFVQRVLNTAVNSTLDEAIYDTEWSNNGQYLYISRHGEAGIQADVVQFDLLNPTTTLASVLPQPNTIFRSFGLQMAPDSAIYHLYQATNGGPLLAGTLNNTDTVASEVIYDANAFNSNPDFGGMQFPSFAPKDSIEFTVTFTTEGTCANAPVSFYPTVDPAADSLIWSFGDGQFANEWSPVHTYDQGGSFQVDVVAFLNGDTATASQPLTITQFDLELTLVQDTTACACELPVNNGVGTCPDDTSDDFEVSVQTQGGIAPQFQWFGPGGLLPGQTTETLRPDSAGYYYVVATDGACSAYAGVNIKEYDSLDQRANIWYFGNNAGIDFNPLPDDPAVAIDGPLVTPEGTSVISDRNGQVIFSTDGFSIFDKSGNDITPPGGIGGENGATQSALIIPVPGDETLYYIFTTREIYGTGAYELRYSLYDLKLNNGVGGLAESNQLLFAPSTERITGDANWLIAHEYGNNSFRAYRITPNGISNPVISDIGSDHAMTSAENGQGYMKLGAQNRLVVALSTPGVSNVVEVFDFIDSTGVVTNFRTADLASTTGQVYGVEVSPAGNKLFATLKDANSTMYEFAFDSLGNPYLKQSVAQTGELGAIQIGPDGQLYVAINGSASLGMFQANEDTTALTALNLQPFDLGGNTSTLGLPNFIQSISNPTTSPNFSFTGLCLGDSTQFTAVGKDPAIDKFDWTFGDGQVAIDSGAQVAHLYALPGTYDVVLTIRNKCENPVATFTQQVVINDVPPDPSTAVAICAGGAVLDANPQDLPDFTYVWSTGDSTETITVNQQAMYTVTVTDALGCSTDGTLMAADNRPQVDLGPDRTLCQNTPVADLDAQNPGATYAWELNGAASGTAQTHAVNTSAFGVFEYKVLVTDPVTNCFVRDSTTFTINESPVFNVTNNSPIACNAATGEITLNFTTPAGSLFSYFISGPTAVPPGTDQSAGSVITTLATLAAGTYGVTVSDQVSGCATITTTSIASDALTVDAAQFGNCDPVALEVTLTATPGPLNYEIDYRIIDNTTAAEVETGSIPSGLTFTTDPAGIPSNNRQYVVEVTTDDGCVATSPPVDVNQSATVPVTLATDPCVEPVTVTATGGTSWSWSVSGGLGTIDDPAAQTAVIRNLPQGNNTILLTVADGVLCPRDTSITVNVNNNINATFSQTDECSDQVILSASPAGPYTYRWYRNGALIPGGQQIVAGLADNGALYRVEVVNTVSGCVFDYEQTVIVSGELDFTLNATPPCEGQPFTLTATPNQPGTTFEWRLDGTVLSGETLATLVETRGGLYDITVTNASGACSVTQNFNVVPSPVTPGDLPGSGIICPDPANPDPLTRQVLLDPGPDFTSYTWYRDNSPLNEDSQTYTATMPGTYSVDLINIYGCPSSDETLLIEDCTPRITGPNAFRPTSDVQANGEFANRNFRLFTFFIDDQDFEVFIFSRWGEMVYHTTERDFRWNGGYNNSAGHPLPTGTYTYVVRYRSSYRPEEGIQETRGGVVLLR